ncbi:MAG: hypothetical protein ACTSVU_05070 [Promethearchaeota archaeon]
MSPSPIFLQTMITFLHNIFTSMWIGGMLTLLLVVMPTLKKVLGKSKESHAFNIQFKKKLSILIYISMVGLIITGLMLGKKAQTAGIYTGFMSFGTEYSTILSIKHILYILMVGLAVFRSQIIDRIKNLTQEQKMKLNMIILILNVLIGLTVLLLSAWIGTLATMLKP